MCLVTVIRQILADTHFWWYVVSGCGKRSWIYENIMQGIVEGESGDLEECMWMASRGEWVWYQQQEGQRIDRDGRRMCVDGCTNGQLGYGIGDDDTFPLPLGTFLTSSDSQHGIPIA